MLSAGLCEFAGKELPGHQRQAAGGVVHQGVHLQLGAQVNGHHRAQAGRRLQALHQGRLRNRHEKVRPPLKMENSGFNIFLCVQMRFHLRPRRSAREVHSRDAGQVGAAGDRADGVRRPANHFDRLS